MTRPTIGPTVPADLAALPDLQELVRTVTALTPTGTARLVYVQVHEVEKLLRLLREQANSLDDAQAFAYNMRADRTLAEADLGLDEQLRLLRLHIRGVEARLAAKTARIEELGALCEKAEEENGRLRAVLIDVRELGIPVEHGGDPAMIIPRAVWMRAAEAAKVVKRLNT
jgi:hypothetical protein